MHVHRSALILVLLPLILEALAWEDGIPGTFESGHE